MNKRIADQARSWSSFLKVRHPIHKAIVGVAILLLMGCADPAEQSRQNMHKLQGALIEYTLAHKDEWPDKLDQIKDKVGGEAEFAKLMK